MSAVLASKEEATYELVEEALHGSVDEIVVRAIARALVQHTAAVSDEAQLLSKPMDRDFAMQMASKYDHVAAYVLVTLDEILSSTSDGLNNVLSEKVATDLELENVVHEIVWGARSSLIFYVRGTVAT